MHCLSFWTLPQGISPKETKELRKLYRGGRLALLERHIEYHPATVRLSQSGCLFGTSTLLLRSGYLVRCTGLTHAAPSSDLLLCFGTKCLPHRGRPQARNSAIHPKLWATGCSRRVADQKSSFCFDDKVVSVNNLSGGGMLRHFRGQRTMRRGARTSGS